MKKRKDDLLGLERKAMQITGRWRCLLPRRSTPLSSHMRTDLQ